MKKPQILVKDSRRKADATFRQPKQSNKCYREGKISINPFLNFVRQHRKEHCGLSITEHTKRAAHDWKNMNEQEKCCYRMMAYDEQKRRKKLKVKKSVVKMEKLEIKIKKEPKNLDFYT